jgi:hypothetical protein
MPVWSFTRELSCGKVRIEGDRFLMVGQPGDSPVHALGHIGLRTLPDRQARANPKELISRARALRGIENWAGVAAGHWSAEQEERFVQQFELYVAAKVPVMAPLAPAGEGLSPVLRALFEEVWPLKEFVDRLAAAKMASTRIRESAQAADGRHRSEPTS